MFEVYHDDSLNMNHYSVSSDILPELRTCAVRDPAGCPCVCVCVRLCVRAFVRLYIQACIDIAQAAQAIHPSNITF